MEAIIKAKHKRKTITKGRFLGVSWAVPLPPAARVFLSWGAVFSFPLVTQHSCLGVHEESDQKTDLDLKVAALE